MKILNYELPKIGICSIMVIPSNHMANQPSPTDCAYAAGLFDGEGHVREDGSLTLSSADFEMIYWLKARWGGVVSKVFKTDDRFKDLAVWTLGNSRQFILDIEPYIVNQRKLDGLLAAKELKELNHQPASERRYALRFQIKRSTKRGKTAFAT